MFTATTRCGIRNSDAIWAWRRDCSRTPWRASTSTIARCAVEAPVRFGVYYATSDNLNRRWDMTDTLVELGYRPQDRWHEAAGEEEDVVPGGDSSPDTWPDA